ncbi:MAG: hypothetical protein QOG08_1396, partial [Chloroflexota bacterium]|nr:hypothetical protein [Chloroflexota bacterium]
YFIVSLPPGTQISSDPSCVAGSPSTDCTTAGFINSHFTACYPATCQVNTFFDQYVATDQGLVYHEWKNASANRGGDKGDIANT